MAWWSRTRSSGPHPERLHRLNQRLGARLLADAEQSAPVAEPPEQRPEVDRRLRGRIADPEVRDELVDGHEARGGSSTCVRVRPPVELTVALDATLWDEPMTGIARYAREVAGALGRRGVRVLRVGARRSGELPAGCGAAPSTPSPSCRGCSPRSGASVFHAVGERRPPAAPHSRGAVRAHGARPHSPHLAADSVSRAFHWQFRLWLARSLRVADHVVCVSAWTR